MLPDRPIRVATSRRGGFSLVLSLTVMSMLLLLCIGAAALLAIELRASRASAAYARARLNAVAGARVALGQLQLLAGPDQRITAPADLMGGGGANKSLPAAAANAFRRRWTGVWSSGGMNQSKLHDWSPGTPDKKPFAGWLVSGADAKGAYSPLENPMSRDSVSQSGSADKTLAAATSEPVAGEVLIVGNGSVGDGGESRGDFVKVPRVRLEDGAGRPQGGFAYWVSDEGQKATLTVSDALSGSADSKLRFSDVSDAERRLRTGVAGRPAIGLVKDSTGKALFPDFATARAADIREANAQGGQASRHTLLENGVGTRATFLNWYALRGGNATADAESLKKSFHHVTAFNKGLLTDTRNGGLKFDLSTAFEMPFEDFKKLPQLMPLGSNSDTLPVQSKVTAGAPYNPPELLSQWSGRQVGYVFEMAAPAGNGNLRGPTWDLLRNHYRLYKRERETMSGLMPGIADDEWAARGAEPFSFAYSGAAFTADKMGGGAGDASQKFNAASLQPVWLGDAATSLGATAYSVPGNGAIAPATTAALSPRVIRIQLRFSLIFLQDSIGIGVDPIVFLHNPYDVPIRFQGISCTFSSMNNVLFTLRRSVDDAIVAKVTLGDVFQDKTYGAPFNNAKESNKRGIIFRVLPTGRSIDAAPATTLRLEPGEVRVASCGATGNSWQLNDSLSNSNFIPGDIAEYGTKLSFLIQSRVFDPALGAAAGEYLAKNQTNDKTLQARITKVISPAPLPGSTTPPAQSPLYVEMSTVDDRPTTQSGKNKMVSFDIHLLRPENYFNIGKSLRRSFHGASQRGQEAAYYDVGDDHLLQRININLAQGPHAPGNVVVRSNDISRDPIFFPVGKDLPSGKTHFALMDVRMRSAADSVQSPPYAQAAPSLIPLIGNPRATLADPRNAEGQQSTSATAPMWQCTFEKADVMTNFPLANDKDGKPTRSYWGRDFAPSGDLSVILHEVPRLPGVSLAALGHADVATLDNQPSLHLGNSYPNPQLPTLEKLALTPTGGGIELYDLTFAMNEALYDRYFFSGLAWKSDAAAFDPMPGYAMPTSQDQAFAGLFESQPKNPFLNKTVRFEKAYANADGFKSPAKLARQLSVPGAFNVNSTSVEAWKALLGSLGNEVSPGAQSDPGSPYLFSRMLTPPINAADKIFSNPAKLTDGQIEKIATELVNEVRRRGPFMSLADFVNRRLDNAPEAGGKGALQAALDKAALPDAALPPLPENPKFPQLKHYGTNGKAPSPVSGNLGQVLQMDILNALGCVLTPRSDTFVIRAYGDSEEGGARAVCELVVTRTPEWVKETDAPDALVPNPGYRSDSPEFPIRSQFMRNPELKAPNRLLGRRYRIVSQRWLDASEI